MKRSVVGIITTVLILMAWAAIAQQPGTPSLPQRRQTTIEDLRLQIGDCTINARSDAAYISDLQAKIAQLEKQIADLTGAAQKTAPPKE